LVIGAHSLSELDWTTFCDYFENVACKSSAVFCATHRSRLSVELVEKKLNLIAQRVNEDRRFLSENGQVADILFRSK
jgi:hypothetical protein